LKRNSSPPEENGRMKSVDASSPPGRGGDKRKLLSPNGGEDKGEGADSKSLGEQ
jgi:hypothetical protein